MFVYKTIFKVKERGVNVGRKKKNPVSNTKIINHPAATPEARENQLIGRAVDLAEQQLIDGTASSQVITHFLKLGSTKEKLERELLEEQRKLLVAKTEALESAKRIEELYTNALSAMREYSGKADDE